MATFVGNDSNNLWLIIQPGPVTIDGKGGTDTIDLGISLRDSYDIYRTADGAVHVDSISGASGSGALLTATLFNIELLTFDSRRVTLDLRTLFGDITPPTVLITDDSPGTAIGPVTYTLAFSEAVSGLTAEALAVTGGKVVSVSGSGATWAVVVVPTSGANGSLSFTLKSAAVVDVANNANAEASAAAQPFDTLAPTWLSGNPAAGALGVALNSALTLSFSEAVQRGSGSITLRDAAGNVRESFDAATSTRLSLAGNQLTIDPTLDLAPGTTYSVAFAAGSLRDLAGNSYSGLGLTPYSFTSAAAVPAPTPTTTLVGTAGNDAFAPAASITRVEGLGGVDTVALASAGATFKTASSAGVFKLTALDGSRSLDLSQVERLVFTNGQLAIDLDGSAGVVAKILGAVFGAASVRNAEYVGIGLKLLDGGTSYASLMQLALDARLGAAASHVAVVDLLYSNVVGAPPSPAEAALYVALLDNRSYTPATLGVLAADTDLNKINIDLVGLAQVGLPYVLG